MTGEKNPEERAERADELISIGNALIAEIEILTKDSGDQFLSLAKRARTNRMLILVTIFSVLIDFALSIAMIFVMIAMQHNTDRIDALTQRLDTAQTVQRQKALCPLYQIFLDSKSAAGRAAAPDPEKYDHAFVVIKQGYDALECDQYITGDPGTVSPGP